MEHIKSYKHQEKINNHIGKKIDTISIGNYSLEIKFEDGSILEFKDSKQSCCENRYMTCDDNIDDFTGKVFKDVSIRNGNGINTKGHGDHDIEFLLIHTDNGDITVSNHNEHNGYYSGFNITVREK